MSEGHTDMFSLMPPIRRARGYRLYTEDGRRLVDLYQNNGHAILGHRAGRLTTAIKNTISRGVIADLPSVWTRRLEKAVKGLVPEAHHVVVASSLEEALSAVNRALGTTIVVDDIADPLWEPDAPISFLRPMCDSGSEGKRIVVPILPFAMGDAPVVICVMEDIPGTPPSCPPVSPVLLSGCVRAIHDLRNHQRPGWEKDDFAADLPGWRRQGPYLVPVFGKENHEEVFCFFLEKGFLLPPHYPGPAILAA